MKKFGLLFFTFCLFNISNIYPQAVLNSDFESWTGSVPDNWTLDTRGGVCAFSQTTGEAGFGLRCVVSTDGSDYDGEFSQLVNDIVEGSSHDFVVRVKGTTGSPKIKFYGTWKDNADGDLTSFNIRPTPFFNPPATWDTYSIIGAVAPSGAVKVVWAIRLYGTQTTDFDNVTSPMPVELTSFSVVIINNGIKLNWRTETEVNNYGFEVERQVGSKSASGGAAGNWEKIGFVEGHGNTNSPKEYEFIDENILSGRHAYRLKQIDNDGTYEFSKVIEIDVDAPVGFKLSQNYPNPFNPTTTIKFNLPESEVVKIVVYDILGIAVKTLVNEFKEAGIHTINFNASEFASGTYVYRIETSNYVDIKKMLLIK